MKMVLSFGVRTPTTTASSAEWLAKSAWAVSHCAPGSRDQRSNSALVPA